MAARSRKRFRKYTAKTNPEWPGVYSGICVSDQDGDACGAVSGALADYDALVKWVTQHCADTNGIHQTFRRSVTDGMFVEPGEWQ